MNLSKKFPLALVTILIVFSLFDVFEEPALKFVSSVFEKNLRFLKLTSEVQLVISGLSSIKLPIIEGITKDVSSGLSHVIEYLLVTDIISFCQVMLLSISKSWILKLITVLLFLLSFMQTTKAICTKLLILSLALSPGLAIYSLGVQKLAQETSIDFGEKYLAKLESQVSSVKAEKAELMKQHSSDLTKIKNGQKGIHILQKFREDVSYDFKRLKNDIHGSHAHIRLLLHEAGHEMKSKVYGFCSMVLFCLFVLPIGYVLIVYMLISSLFNINSTHLGALAKNAVNGDKKGVDKSDFVRKLKRVFNVYLEEFHSVESKVLHSGVAHKVESEAEGIERKVVSKVEDVAGDEIKHLESKVTEEVAQVKSTVKEKASLEKAKVETEAASTETETKTVISKPKKGEGPSTLSI